MFVVQQKEKYALDIFIYTAFLEIKGNLDIFCIPLKMQNSFS